MKYIIKEPKYFKGQKVAYINHRKHSDEGEIRHVETHYSSRSGDGTFSAYHTYNIMKDERNTRGDYKRGFWIGEDNIIGLLE